MTQSSLFSRLFGRRKKAGLNSSDIDILIEQGVRFDEKGKYKKAISCYEQALAINPQSITAMGAMGNSLGKLDRAEDAIDCWDKILEVCPEARQPIVLATKGSCLHALGRYDDAIQCCDQALAIDSNYAAALFYKALSMQSKALSQQSNVYWSQVVVAWEFYFRAAKADPTQIDSLQKAETCNKEAVIKAFFPPETEALQSKE